MSLLGSLVCYPAHFPSVPVLQGGREGGAHPSGGGAHPSVVTLSDATVGAGWDHLAVILLNACRVSFVNLAANCFCISLVRILLSDVYTPFHRNDKLLVYLNIIYLLLYVKLLF